MRFYNACNHELSTDKKFYSYGRCPHCGFKDNNSVTIVGCYEIPYKLVREYPDAPWWKFWLTRKTIRYFKEVPDGNAT